jgi:hypothetical protein
MSAGKAVMDVIQSFLGAFENMQAKGGDSVQKLITQATKGISGETVFAGSKVGPLRKIAQSFVGLNKGNDEIVSRRFAGDVSKRLYGAIQSRNALEEVVRGTKGFADLDKPDMNRILAGIATGKPDDFLGDISKNDTLNEAIEAYTGSLRGLGIKASADNMGEIAGLNTTLAGIASSDDAMRTLGMNIKNAGIRGQAGAMFGARFTKNGKTTPVRGIMGMAAPGVGITLGTNFLSVPNKVLDVATEDAIRRGRI